MILYDRQRSGNCYRVRLMLGLLSIAYERVPINTAGGGSVYYGTASPEVPDDPDQRRVDDPAEKGINRSAWFLELNPRGQVPVLDDGGQVIWDSTAILIYLARKFGGESWLPADALGEAHVAQWLALAQNELLYGVARCRGILEMGRPGDLAECRALGRAGLDAMERRLTRHDWLALGRPTIGDVACFPAASLAPTVGISHDDYPALERWVRRIHALPGFVGLHDP